ncbi:MAG: hypothetical protein JWP44_1227, partial [Mucilaginibacter sp.]|nr:hypothetical protein [Mucilaginibacter sp.]
NKQVERKLLLDLLLHFREIINLNNYTYLGMGSVFYYDFILVHRVLGLNKLISIDSKETVKRFNFNKPYDFIDFENITTTKYLAKYDWQKNNSIIWLDYDSQFSKGADSIINDIKILAKNCVKNDLVFLTVNTYPLQENQKQAFLDKYAQYISVEFNKLSFTSKNNFPRLIQNIIHNVFISENLYNKFRYNKICSFLYSDGALMFTLGCFFTDDKEQLKKVKKLHPCISFSPTNIQTIEIPHITYKEKHYLDSNIIQLTKWVRYYSRKVKKTEPNEELAKKKVEEILNQKMEIELNLSQIKNYIENYRFMPQYYEGMI